MRTNHWTTHCTIAVVATAVITFTTRCEVKGEVTRIFIFAGQSNMVGSDSKVQDVDHFPPFRGFAEPQPEVMFSYCIGRENKLSSDGWGTLQPINNVVGPELSFARTVCQSVDYPIAIIKVAAGGTHLGGDWNPDDPQGFKMYPLALDIVQKSLAALTEKNIEYKLEGFVWHQGENDMFNEDYMSNYGRNLNRFLECWRRDLNEPNLRFYIGELCTKTIWGMDLRPRMYAISRGQRQVTDSDPLAEYIPTAHIGVEIGGGVGLHYHYGTLGQLEHGVNYAEAYLNAIGKRTETHRTLDRWPFEQGSRVRLLVLAGHRNMEGERAFIQDVQKHDRHLLDNDHRIAFRYSVGGGYRESAGWEPMGPAGCYDTFGPELSMCRKIRESKPYENLAVLKFTHSGSQMNDWTPEGSMARSRHLYPSFIRFVRQAIKDLADRGHEVDLAGIFYHVGENEMSMPPYRKQAAEWLRATITQSRRDLDLPELQWFVSQQPPTNHERVNNIDVVRDIKAIAEADPHVTHIEAFNLPPQPKQLVIDTAGMIALGELLAASWLSKR